MRQDWDKFWNRLSERESLLGKLLSFYRVQIIARALNHYVNKYFKSTGIFAECGAGTSETTLKTKKKKRKFVAIDYSSVALKKASSNPKIDSCVKTDIFSLPFKDNSLDGIWNVGVMEHFNTEDINKILREFRRVLQGEGRIILLWPMAYSPYEIFINMTEAIANIFSAKRFKFYPDEISRLKSKSQGLHILKKNGFSDPKVYFNFRDAFSFGVVVGQK